MFATLERNSSFGVRASTGFHAASNHQGGPTDSGESWRGHVDLGRADVRPRPRRERVPEVVNRVREVERLTLTAPTAGRSTVPLGPKADFPAPKRRLSAPQPHRAALQRSPGDWNRRSPRSAASAIRSEDRFALREPVLGPRQPAVRSSGTATQSEGSATAEPGRPCRRAGEPPPRIEGTDHSEPGTAARSERRSHSDPKKMGPDPLSEAPDPHSNTPGEVFVSPDPQRGSHAAGTKRLS